MRTPISPCLLLSGALALLIPTSLSVNANSHSEKAPAQIGADIKKAETSAPDKPSPTLKTDEELETSQIDTEATAPEIPDYQDDRSTPSKLIESYYNAINRKEIVRAYGYYSEEGRDPFYDSYEKGYSDTKNVKIILGTPQADPGAGTFYWSQPLALEAENNDGKRQVYAGCYTIRMLNPAMQAIPPFRPMEIMTGTLSLSPLQLEKSVPENCDAP